jgi:hypothetical protein
VVVPDALPETLGIVGNVKLKPGFNCVLVVDELNNAIVISASEKAGAGEQCVDLRTLEDGTIVEDNCMPCRGPIYTINGRGNDDEAFQLVGGPGVVIDPFPDRHEIIISLDEEGICDVRV